MKKIPALIVFSDRALETYQRLPIITLLKTYITPLSVEFLFCCKRIAYSNPDVENTGLDAWL